MSRFVNSDMRQFLISHYLGAYVSTCAAGNPCPGATYPTDLRPNADCTVPFPHTGDDITVRPSAAERYTVYCFRKRYGWFLSRFSAARHDTWRSMYKLQAVAHHDLYTATSTVRLRCCAAIFAPLKRKGISASRHNPGGQDRRTGAYTYEPLLTAAEQSRLNEAL
jgi:hypothetical protein